MEIDKSAMLNWYKDYWKRDLLLEKNSMMRTLKMQFADILRNGYSKQKLNTTLGHSLQHSFLLNLECYDEIIKLLENK